MAGEWRADPGGQFDYRWWDGTAWTDQVSAGGVVQTAPLPATGAAPAPAPPPAASGHPFGGVSGDLVDGAYAEHEGDAVANQNRKMLRVRLSEPILARQGSMVAYQGAVSFDFQGAGGAAKWLKKTFTGEGLPLMKVSGTGDVFLADQAYDVHLLHLDGGGLSVNGRNILAFSERLDMSIERIQGAGMLSGGLYNTTLRGSGWVAITTDGAPVVLDASAGNTHVDSDAVVAWTAGLTTSVKSSFKATALIGRGSGEVAQIAFAGNGHVIVQPSEGQIVGTGQDSGGSGLGKLLGG